MAASQGDIRGWIARARSEGATHMIVVCDSFDHDDYPVLVKPGEDAREVASRYDGKNMQCIMEVYSMALDTEGQLQERRAFHYE